MASVERGFQGASVHLMAGHGICQRFQHDKSRFIVNCMWQLQVNKETKELEMNMLEKVKLAFSSHGCRLIIKETI